MAVLEHTLQGDEIHPIDIVETLAERHEWEFDRVADDQIAMAVDGQWRCYSLTLAWSGIDETLRLICTFELEPSDDRLGALYELLSRANDRCWAGAFTYWYEQRLMVWRYGLVLTGGQIAGAEQIDRMIAAAIGAAERYYPAFQMVSWSNCTAPEALELAIAKAYGRA